MNTANTNRESAEGKAQARAPDGTIELSILILAVLSTLGLALTLSNQGASRQMNPPRGDSCVAGILPAVYTADNRPTTLVKAFQVVNDPREPHSVTTSPPKCRSGESRAVGVISIYGS